MILIYERDDLSAEGKGQLFQFLNVQHVRGERRQLVAEGHADTIYIEGLTPFGDAMKMVKQRNMPLDPYPCIIEYKRARF